MLAGSRFAMAAASEARRVCSTVKLHVQVAERSLQLRARRHDGRRVHLLDDRGAGDAAVRGQPVAVVDRRRDEAGSRETTPCASRSARPSSSPRASFARSAASGARVFRSRPAAGSRSRPAGRACRSRRSPCAGGESASTSFASALLVEPVALQLQDQLEVLPEVAQVGEPLERAALLASRLSAMRRRACASVSKPVVERARGSPRSARTSRVRLKSPRTSACSRPIAESSPGRGGTSTLRMPMLRATSAACSGPAPPNATSVKSRGSSPCSTEITRTAPIMLTLMISSTPAAALVAVDAELARRASSIAARAPCRRASPCARRAASSD